MIGVLGSLCLYGRLSRSPGQCHDKGRTLILYTLHRDLSSMRRHNFLHNI